MEKDRRFASPTLRAGESPARKLRHLLWLCPLVGLVAGAAILWLYGFTLWAAIALILLAACPLIIVWGLMIGRSNALDPGEDNEE